MLKITQAEYDGVIAKRPNAALQRESDDTFNPKGLLYVTKTPLPFTYVNVCISSNLRIFSFTQVNMEAQALTKIAVFRLTLSFCLL